MTKMYYDRDGNRVPRHLAVGSNGIVKSGYSVSVGVMAADSAAPGMTPVRDTPSKPTDAYDAYLARMTKRGAKPATDAIPATAEGHDAYVARMKRAKKEA